MASFKMHNVEFLYSKIFSGAGIGASIWGIWDWMGHNHHQISVVFGLICTVIAIATFIRGK